MSVDSERRFHVRGIHCAGCVSRIRGALERLPGVEVVGLGIEGDLVMRGHVDPQLVRDSVEALGFELSDSTERVGTTEGGSMRAGERKEVLELTVAILLFLPLMGGTMLSHLFGWHGSAWWDGSGGAFLSGLILFGCAWRRWVAVARTLSGRALSMDVTVMSGGLIAWAVSLVGVLRGGAVYFEAASGIVVVQMLGRWIESRLRRRAGDAIEALGRLQAASVLVLSAEGVYSSSAEEVRVGERFVVRTGERFPLDGVVESGASSVDVSWLTGESAPRRLTPGAEVIAGALNLGGEVTVRSTETVHSGTLSRMANLMRVAGAQGGQGEGMVDRWVARFSAGLFLVAVAAGLGWYVLANLPWDHALLRAATVLVAGCPCALGLAVPMVYRVAVGAGVKRGVLIGDAARFVSIARVTDMIFDKTGTLTEPLETAPALELADGSNEREFWANALGLEEVSRHPFAESVRRHAVRLGISPVTFSEGREIPGEGVEGVHEGRRWRLVRDGVGWSRLESSGVFVGRARFPEKLRQGAKAVVRELVARGVRVHVASGDVEERVFEIGRGLGMPLEHCHAGMRPEDKLALCRKLRSEGGLVAMVGDGVNDAAVLFGADVGVAVRGASGVARASAHIELLGPGLEGLVEAHWLGRMVERAVRQNLGFAIVYNLVTVPVATGVFLGAAGWDFSPMQASLAMAASSLSVVGNALLWGRRFASRREK